MTTQAEGVYDNAFYDDNVYGHALELLRRSRGEAKGEPGLHLDIGCGYGRIADPLVAELGLTYVGVDADAGGLAALAARGFETHELWLADEDETFAALERIVAGRRLASVSMLDTLEHLANGDATLRAIARLAVGHGALVVLSVPNVTHADIGFRLAFGRWDYTEVGLLDHTHLRLFSQESLDTTLRRCGLYPVESNDVVIPESDQHFPADHPALARGTSLHGLLRHLRGQAEPADTVNQFVRLCAAGRPAVLPAFASPDENRPFLSVIMRTQGTRLHTLTEALTALAGQTDTDFEVIVVGHRIPVDRQKAVERAIEDSPEWLRERCRLIRVNDGNRTRPLNEGFAAAQGRYIAILDDDDMPLGHWVEVFRGLHQAAPGCMLRAATVRQDVVNVTVDGAPGLRATGPLEKPYAATFDLFEHFRCNQTPPVSIAFPRGVFHDLGMRFDEALTTTEDWDFLLRVAMVVGTKSSPEITSIYRWWPKDESSRTVHAPEEWGRNYNFIIQKADMSPMVCPPGTVTRIRGVLDERDRFASEAGQLRAQLGDSGGALTDARLAGLREVHSILNSTSWRVTKPIRIVARILGRPAEQPDQMWNLDSAALARLADAMRQSTSWRITAPLRRLRPW